MRTLTMTVAVLLILTGLVQALVQFGTGSAQRSLDSRLGHWSQQSAVLRVGM